MGDDASIWQQAAARVPDLIAMHIRVSFAALVLALLIAAPLAVLAHRRRRVGRVVLGGASLIQTIPGIALLALFFPLLVGLSHLLGGAISPLGFLPALLALTLYALLPILRNAVTGLDEVDAAAREAADGIGMTSFQKLVIVELPLASPTIIAGIRTAAVWTIGAATLATTIGQPSLGDLIFAGLQIQSWPLVLVGCMASAALAIAVDAAIGIAERAITHGRRRLAAAAGLVVLAIAGFGAVQPLLAARHSGAARVVTIGAKGFTEQYILAHVIGDRLVRAGIPVRYREGLGSAVLFGALDSGDVDIAVDYAGTVWTNEMHRHARPDPATMRTAIGHWLDTSTSVRLIGPLGFENAYAFAVTGGTAARYRLVTLDDLARASDRLSMATDPEFLERPEWRAVRASYPLRFAAVRSISAGLLYAALAAHEVDVVTAYTSDGRIAADHLTVLADPHRAIPSYEALLLANRRVAGDPRIMAVLRGLVGKIGVEAMRHANYSVDRATGKLSPADAARRLEREIGGS